VVLVVLLAQAAQAVQVAHQVLQERVDLLVRKEQVARLALPVQVVLLERVGQTVHLAQVAHPALQEQVAQAVAAVHPDQVARLEPVV
jgi:hypothetical protein